MQPKYMQCVSDSITANKRCFVFQQASVTNPALEKMASVKNLLMLQGPVGPMFDRIAICEKQHGGKVTLLLFNAGDVLFCRTTPSLKYKGKLADWPQYLRKLIQLNAFDAVLLFGQSRKYHACAITVCRALGLQLFVMEEGYIRPGYITLEQQGVNGFSTTLRCYRADTVAVTQAIKPTIGPNQFLRASIYAGIYYIAMAAGKQHFANYQHHRDSRLLPHLLN